MEVDKEPEFSIKKHETIPADEEKHDAADKAPRNLPIPTETQPLENA